MKYRLIKEEDLNALFDLIQRVFDSKVESIKTIDDLDFRRIVQQFDMGVGRKHKVVKMRHFMRFFLAMNTKINLKEIGKLTGGKEHSIVINSVKTLRNWMDTDPAIRLEYEEFENLFWRKIDAAVKIENCIKENEPILVNSEN